MKKCKICILLVLSLLMTGCRNSVNLTEAQSDEAAEYIGGVLLEYSSDYEGVLLPEDDIEADSNNQGVSNTQSETDSKSDAGLTDSSQQSQTGISTEKTADTQQEETTVGEIMGCSGFDVQAADYELYNSYPKNGNKNHFVLTASSGKKLLVMRLSIKNISGSKKKINTTNSVFECTASGNGFSGKALISLLKNDVHFLSSTVEAGKSITAFLVFEVDKTAELNNLEVTVSGTAGTAELSFK